MKKVKIIVMRKAKYDDLIKTYENPLEHPCDMQVGRVFISENAQKPLEFCNNAWETLQPFVTTLAQGGGDFYDGWAKICVLPKMHHLWEG